MQRDALRLSANGGVRLRRNIFTKCYGKMPIAAARAV